MKKSIFLLRYFKLFGLLLLVFSFLATTNVEAQRKSKSYLKKKNRKIGNYRGGSIHFDKNKRYINLGVSIDALNYFGDLAPKANMASTDISFTRPAFTIYGSYRWTPYLSLRGSLGWGRIVGDDYESASTTDSNSKFRYIRNLSFRNDIKEFSAVAVLDIFGNHGTFLNRVPFTPYLFGGVAVFHHSPKAKAPEFDKFGNPLAEAGQWVNLRELGTEGQLSPHYDVKQYSVIQPSIPFGVGVRARLQKRLDFEFEVGYRFLFTDYIDDVSGMYVDLGALDSELARAMSDRSREEFSAYGNPRDFEGTITPNTTLVTLDPSPYDGREYTIYGGYGQEHPTANRGSANDNDIYIVTSFKITYIISGSFRRAKFR